MKNNKNIIFVITSIFFLVLLLNFASADWVQYYRCALAPERITNFQIGVPQNLTLTMDGNALNGGSASYTCAYDPAFAPNWHSTVDINLLTCTTQASTVYYPPSSTPVVQTVCPVTCTYEEYGEYLTNFPDGYEILVHWDPLGMPCAAFLSPNPSNINVSITPNGNATIPDQPLFLDGDANGGVQPYTYAWTLAEEDETCEFSTLTAIDTNVTCSTVGERTAILTVTDSNVGSIPGITTVDISVSSAWDINTLQQLTGGGSYSLPNDINALETLTWNAGSGFNPISTFTGTLNGGGHTITGLYINRPATNYVGLFSQFNGTLSNITIKDSNINGYNWTGAFVGSGAPTLTDVTVRNSNIFSAGNVGYVGGIIGSYTGNSFANNETYGIVVRGLSYVGGMIGYYVTAANNVSLDINNCYADSNTISATGATPYVGGIVGRLSNTGTGTLSAINRSSSYIRTLSGLQYVGGLVGGQDGTGASITDSNATIPAWSLTGTSFSYIGGLAGSFGSATGGTITRSSSTIDLDINNTGSAGNYVGGLVGYGTGSTIINSYSDVNIDTTLNNLNYVNSYVGGLIGYGLNIISSFSRGDTIKASLKQSGGAAGYYVGGLGGEIDGNISDSNATFTTIMGGAIAAGDSYTGGLVGYFKGTYVIRSYADANLVSAYRTDLVTSYVGGLIGGITIAGKKDINNCYADVHNLATYRNTGGSNISGIGGLIGYVTASVAINLLVNSSYSQSDLITATGEGIGGLIGYMSNSSSTLKVIDSNAITGRISGSGSYAQYLGGLVGGVLSSTRIDINNSFAISQIDQNITAALNYVGGLAGGLTPAGIVYNSWADTNINGSIGTYAPGRVGGLIGLADVNILNSYARGNYIKITKGNGAYVGGLVGIASGYIIDSNAVFVDINGSSTTSGYGYLGGLVGGYTGPYILRSKVIASNIAGYRSDSLTGEVGGLVGYITSAKNVDINDCVVNVDSIIGYKNSGTGYSNVGGLIGIFANASYTLTVARCKVDSNLISATSSYVGGLLGNVAVPGSSYLRVLDSNVRISRININGTPAYIGGLIGAGPTNNLISNTFAITNLDMNNLSVTQIWCGGLIGYLAGGTVEKSYADTNINAIIGTNSGQYIGGLIGQSSAKINDSYANMNFIKATNPWGNYIGGLVGKADANIVDSYATVTLDVNGRDYVGGLAGSLGTNATIRNSFFVGRAKASTTTNDSNTASNASATNIINCYFYKTGTTNVCLQQGTTLTCNATDPAQADYFKGKTSLIRVRAPFSGGTIDWNFNYVGNSGTWYGWRENYPHFTIDPNTPHVLMGEYKSVAIDLLLTKKCEYVDFDFTQVEDSTVNIQIQIGDSNAVMWDDSNWFGPDGTNATSYTTLSDKNISISKDEGQWIRWKATLYSSTAGETPSLKSVDFNCVPIGEMVLVANATDVTWGELTYNAIVGGVNGSLEWLYKIGSGNWLTLDNNSFASSTGTPLYIKAKLTGTTTSNAPIIDNNIIVSYIPN